MIVVHITSVEFNPRSGHRNWMLFEVDSTGIKDIVDRLNNGELLYGWSLQGHREKDDGNVFVVDGARETTLTHEEVHRIQQPWWRIVRYEDEHQEEAEEAR